MKVVVLGHDYADSFAPNIVAGFGHLGIEAVLVDSRPRTGRAGAGSRYWICNRVSAELVHRSEKARELLLRDVARRVARESPDLVLVADTSFPAGAAASVRRAAPRAVHALWFPDALSNLGRQEVLASGYDWLFFKDRYLVTRLVEETTLNVGHLPEACNPDLHHPPTPAEVREFGWQGDAVVVGNVYPWRALLLDQIPEDIDLRIHGKISPVVKSASIRDRYSGRYATGAFKRAAFGNSGVVINNLHFAEVRAVNARFFEATACGGLVAVQASAPIEEFFYPGREVLAYRSAAELVELIEAVRAGDLDRQPIVERASERCRTEHTYAARLSTLLATVGRS